jgi:hypothetical protein
MELSMHAGGEPSTTEIRDVLVGRPGWRLEPRSTPGTSPLWCFVFNGKIEFSVAVEEGSIRLYVMEIDRDIIFDDAEGLMTWLRANRAEALLEPEAPVTKKARLRRFTRWT